MTDLEKFIVGFLLGASVVALLAFGRDLFRSEPP
jgi:hypothetical protein